MKGTKQKIKRKSRYKKKEIYKISEETVKNRVIIVNDDQHVATTSAYLFIPNQLYMFRA